MDKLLLYTTVGKSEAYLNLLTYFCESLCFTNTGVKNLLVMCDISFHTKVRTILERFAFLNWYIMDMPDSLSPIQASMHKTKIFDWPHIMEYNICLFVDADCLFLQDLGFIFKKPILDNKLYVYAEHDDPGKNLTLSYTLSNESNYNCNYYSENDYNQLVKTNKYPFNAGLFMFKISPLMKLHFKALNNFMRNSKGTYFYEQSFMNVYFNKRNLADYSIFVKDNYTMHASNHSPKNTLLHFSGSPGAGESKTSFIAVSGSEFQEKYVGVGSSRIRELFKLAKKNVPCIVFIDEIDALGRKRSGDGESSSSERDSTLNELLVALDGFKNTSGIFIIGATNRVDLLYPALIRPGRVDKRIYIGLPDSKTREAILNIHLKGKAYDSKTIIIQDLVELTTGLSGAQIENLVNEAMLNALRNDREIFTIEDIDSVMNKMMVGWQPNEHEFTSNVIDSIAIHEMGHAVVGMLSKHHSKMSKVIINLSSPKTPAYTVFEAATSSIFTREALFEHLMILLAGRIAEEVFFDVSVTTGAINDFEEALKLAQQMIVYYGMGKQIIYPSMSDKYKEMIDSEVATLLHSAYEYAEFIIRNSKDLIQEGAELLKRDKLLKAETILGLLNDKYRHLLSLKMNE
jgi:ATP-dependent metalloprotease FtsH